MNDARQEMDTTTLNIERCGDGAQSLTEKIQNLDLELRAVSIGLKNKIEETETLRKQMSKVIECFPIGAILFNQDRTVLQINQAATRLLESEGALRTGLSLDVQWQELQIPPPPFTSFSYKGKRLKCWEEVIRESGLYPGVTIRLLSEDPANDGHSQDAKKTLRAYEDVGIAKITHDLRNALASIELFSSLVMRRPCNESEHYRLSAHLQKSVRSLERFVSNMLTFSVSQDIHLEKVCLHSLCDHVEVMLTEILETRLITIHRKIASDANCVDGDWGLLQRACLNLLHNAIAVTPEGGTVTIESRRDRMTRPGSSHSEDAVAIEVQDRGCGIREDDLAHVCEPFYTKRNGGTGLGLSIVKDVVDAHQGTLDIQSQVGQGTTISLSFPQQRRSA